MSIASPHTARPKSIDWLTPPFILEALGTFDLDPCAPINRPWDTALRHLTIQEDGLNQPWSGRVWLNPPYCTETWKWMRKIALHGNGIALLLARTETHNFFPWVWDYADAVLFIKGRLTYLNSDGKKPRGNSGVPSVLIAYGSYNRKRLFESGIEGKFLLVPPAPKQKNKNEEFSFPNQENKP